MSIRSSPRPSILALALCGGMTALLGLTVVRDLSSPLIGPRDTNQWEYLGFYVSENFDWTPLPHLDLDTDQVFYPYGVSSVFQSWGLERDLIFSACLRWLGDGPWLRGYYLVSLLIGWVGVYLLLYREVGHRRALIASLFANLFNFYGLNKYPYHLNIAVYHWMILGIVVDGLIFRRVVARQWPGLRLWLIRGCLTLLVLGLDLAYIAAFSLLSLTVTLTIVGLLQLYRRRVSSHQPSNRQALWQQISTIYRRDWCRHRTVCAALLAVMLCLGWLYVPPILGIVQAAGSFEGEPELIVADQRVIMAASPLRLALPYLPAFHPRTPGFNFHDQPEGLGAGSVGWTLLLAALLGTWGHLQNRRLLILLPLVVLGALLVFYSPLLPTLKLLPWTRFTRVASRTTVVLPVLCALVSLGIPWASLTRARKIVVTMAFLLLGATELSVAYGLNHGRHRVHRPTESFLTYMDHVRQQPGEAVLDWPFCVVAGNGVGLDTLCPLYEATHTVSSTRRFHRKKVVGHYFGRLRHSQIAAHLNAGWPKLLATVDEQRCFSPEEWTFFTDFFALNDFAGIQLYPDHLPAACVEQFHRRFGASTATTKLWATGRVDFIPKSDVLRSKVDLEAGQGLQLATISPSLGS